MQIKTIFICIAVFSSFTGVDSARGDSRIDRYSYDHDGRLSTGLVGGTSCLIYAYDANGNRSSSAVVDTVSSPSAWGQANWGSFNWSAGSVNPSWGSGNWGCMSWTSQ